MPDGEQATCGWDQLVESPH